PEEVRGDRDRDEERDAEQDLRRDQRGVQVERHHDERDRSQDQQPADERRDPHAVIQARTASAAATSVATANQVRRARGSAGAYSHGERTASSANVPYA